MSCCARSHSIEHAQYFAERALSLKPGGPTEHLRAFSITGVPTEHLVSEIDLLMLDPDASTLLLARLEALRQHASTWH